MSTQGHPQGRTKSSAKPAPPKTTAGSSATKPLQTCQQPPQKPCDVDMLAVKVQFKEPAKDGGDEKDVVRELQTTTVKRKPVRVVRQGRYMVVLKNYPKLSVAMNERLARYDFVIEAFADFPTPREVDAKGKPSKAALKELATGDGSRLAKEKAKISARARFGGLQCAPQQHGLVAMRPLTRHDKTLPAMTSRKVNQAVNLLPEQSFAAFRFPLLDDVWSDIRDNAVQAGAGSGRGPFLFEFIRGLFQALGPKEVEVVAKACGNRQAGAPQPANQNLKALVRIFRKDVWTLGVKIPSLGEFKMEQGGKRELLTGAREGTFSSSGRFGGNSGSRSTTVTTQANGKVVRESKQEGWRGGKGSSLTQTSTQFGAIKKVESKSQYSYRDGSSVRGYTKGGRVYGKPTRELVAERLKRSTGFDVTLARNGQELANKGTFQKIKTSVGEFAKVLAEVQALFRKAPQVGWKVSFEVSALAGTIVLECAPSAGALTADGRYYPINYHVEGKIEIELVNLKISLSFGVDAQVLESGLVLKVEGSVSVSVKISAKLNLDMITNPKKEIGLVADSTNQLKITGYVSVVGKTVAGAELSVANGFELKDGKLIIDVTKPSFDLKGTLRAKDMTVSGWIKVPLWWDKKVENVKLLDGCDIRTFK